MVLGNSVQEDMADILNQPYLTMAVDQDKSECLTCCFECQSDVFKDGFGMRYNEFYRQIIGLYDCIYIAMKKSKVLF